MNAKRTGKGAAILLIGAYLALSGWNWLQDSFDAFIVTQEELRREPSPDGRLESVVFTRDAGATASTAYLVDVVPAGGRPAKDHAVFITDNTSSVDTRWLANREVLISGHGRIFNQAKRVNVRVGWFGRGDVEVRYNVTDEP